MAQQTQQQYENDKQTGHNQLKAVAKPHNRKLSEETKAKIRKALVGRKHSLSRKNKIRKAMQGNKNRLGAILSQETKIKIRRSLEGKTFITKEGREKIRKANGSRVVKESTRAKLSGNNNPAWKDGLYAERHGLRLAICSSSTYTRWRTTVYKRDGFVCQRCGFCKGHSLNVHHIKPFQQIIKQYNITSLAQAIKCEELWDPNNGVTLCTNCHKKTHNGSTYPTAARAI